MSRDPLEGRSVLITGGAGFLGYNLMLALRERGARVTVVDDESTGSNRPPEDVEYLRLDVAHLDGRHLMPLGPRPLIFHLASAASPPRYQARSLHTLRTNALGTLHLLDLAQRHVPDATVLLASTSEVYGDPLVMPQPETYRGNVSTLGPRACYDEGKRVAETALWEYRNVFGLDTRIVRIFNTYGPHMDPWDGRVVTNFLRQALLGQPLTVYGDGAQTRSLCYVDDLIDGMIRLSLLPTRPLSQDIYCVNIGNDKPITMLDLARTVLRVVGRSDGSIEYRPLPVHDPRDRQPDLTLARSLLDGWEPRTSLERGLLETARSLAGRLDIPRESVVH